LSINEKADDWSNKIELIAENADRVAEENRYTQWMEGPTGYMQLRFQAEDIAALVIVPTTAD